MRRQARELIVSDQFDNYTKVVINVSDESQFVAGTDGGRVLTIDNPLGTQQMANDILAKLRGYRYQPYDASGALIDPAAELGDGLSVNNTYGGIYQNDLTFSRLMSADVSAPCDNEINHEFKYESKTERTFRRELGDVRATLLLQSDMISAKVDNRSTSQSFGWELLEDHWSVTSSNREVFRVDSTGGTFAGEVVAQSGRIGGFTISATAIYNNISEFGGTQSTGVYIGTDGIQLGQGFKVDSSGHMECNNATVRGTIRAGDIQYGGDNGYFDGGGLYGGSVGTYQLSGYCVGGIGGGVGYNNASAQSPSSYPAYWTCGYLNARRGFIFAGGTVGIRQITYKDGSGNSRTITVLAVQ